MKEDFLHYLWKYKKLDLSNLKTTQNEEIIILNSGQYLQKEGPDFFNAQLIIGKQKWAGNIEIHLKSSDWYVHQHEKDDNYNNVILHIVWQHDAPIYRIDNTEIPVLELQNTVNKQLIAQYNQLIIPKSWIFCEKQISSIDDFVLKNWQERLFLERLERKSKTVNELLHQSQNDWESVLFCMLAKNFGLNTNGETFLKIAQSISFQIIRKEAVNVTYIESLLFGQANLFPAEIEDNYVKELHSWYDYLILKYKIKKIIVAPPQFFKHRPDNFPTIRLAQLAMLYYKQRNLFSQIIEAKSIAQLYQIFDVSVSDYWKTHYNFEKPSPKKENSEELISLIASIPAEKNTIIEKFSHFGLISKNAFQSQALLQLKNEYCNNKKCLQCAIGMQLIKN